ncbi:MAG: RDD family protein [Streptosporangiales bacterium]
MASTATTGRAPMPASPWRRLGGFVVDILVITAVLSPLLVPAALAQLDHAHALASTAASPATKQDVAPLPLWARQWFVGVAVALAFGVYRVAQVGAAGRTLGHRVVRVRVVSAEGGRVSWGRAVLRYVAFYGVTAVPVAGPVFSVVNYLWCLFDRPYRQCLHDKVAGTFVLDVSSGTPGGTADVSVPQPATTT